MKNPDNNLGMFGRIVKYDLDNNGIEYSGKVNL